MSNAHTHKNTHTRPAEEEAKVLHGLRNEKRVVISTMADGATGQHALYRDLWGTFIICLGERERGREKAA